MNKELWHKLCEMFSEDECERALEYLETAPQEEILTMIMNHRRIETAMNGFSMGAFNLVERVRILRQEYNRAWDKLHPAKVVEEDEDGES